MIRADTALRSLAIGARAQTTASAAASYHSNSKCTASRAQDLRAPRKRVSISPEGSHALTRKASTAAPSPSTTTTSPLLDWNTFFKLRKTRRMAQLGASVSTSILGIFGGAQALLMTDMDAIVNQIPIDPFIGLGLITFSCGGLGWLLGPSIGTGLFNMTHSKTRGEMIVKEKEFYKRVKKYRVDPSASSMANPVPDYYGEKISSVQGYRQWLKDQRAFNKKRETFVK